MPHKEVIEIIARGLWRRGNRILLCRNRRHGHVFLPGGHVEFGEPAAAALKRELREELGLDLAVGPLLGVCEASFQQQPAKKPGGRRHHEINLLFTVIPPPSRKRVLATMQPNEPVSQEVHIEFIWVPVADLRGPRPVVRLLPRGIVPLVIRPRHGTVPMTTEFDQ